MAARSVRTHVYTRRSLCVNACGILKLIYEHQHVVCIYERVLLSARACAIVCGDDWLAACAAPASGNTRVDTARGTRDTSVHTRPHDHSSSPSVATSDLIIHHNSWNRRRRAVRDRRTRLGRTRTRTASTHIGARADTARKQPRRDRKRPH